MESITYDAVHIPEEEHQYNIVAPNSDPHYNTTVHSGKPEVSFAGNPPSYGVLSGKPHADEKATIQHVYNTYNTYKQYVCTVT